MPISAEIIACLFEEAAEKIVHIDLFLKSLKSTSTPEERELIKFFERVVEELKFERYGVTQAFLDKVPLDKAPNEVIIEDHFIKQSLHKFFETCNGIIAIQQEIDTFVSLPKLPTEIYTTIQSVFSKGQLAKIKIDPTILYTPLNIPSLSKVRRKSVIDIESRPILVIPYIDFSNPIMWAYLFHEIGHAIQRQEEKGNIPNLVLEVVEYLRAQNKLTPDHSLVSDQGTTLNNWISELISDRIALILMGPAFVNSFVLWQLTWSPINSPEYYLPSGTYPSPSHRIKLMNNFFQKYRLDSELSKRYSDLFFTVINQTNVDVDLLDTTCIRHMCPECESEHEAPIPSLPIIKRNAEPGFKTQLEDIEEAIDAVIDQKGVLPIPKNYTNNDSSLKPLIEMLLRRIPIPSRRVGNDESICQKVSQIRELRKTDSLDKADSLDKDFKKLFDELLVPRLKSFVPDTGNIKL